MITTKEILNNIPNSTLFKKWFLLNADVLTKDINEFFKKFNGGKISVDSIKPLTSWSIHIPKEYKTNLYNTLAKLNGQEVIASYGISDSSLNKVIRDALKENNDIEASDEVKAYLKTNYNEFYKSLFDLLRTYETLGNKSAEPIAKILANNLGAEQGRPIKFCQELKEYLTKLIKNVIDSVNNTMKNKEKTITASSNEASVEETLRSILNDIMVKAKMCSEFATQTFSVSDFNIHCEFSIPYSDERCLKCEFTWCPDKIDTVAKDYGCDNCAVLCQDSFSPCDFDSLRKALDYYINEYTTYVECQKVKCEESEVKDIDYSDIKEICNIIIDGGEYDNALKAQANLYISLCTASDVNTSYMQTLADSIISEYKRINNVEVTFKNDILSKLKQFLQLKFNCLSNFYNREIEKREALVCFCNELCLTFMVCCLSNKNYILCKAKKVSGGYENEALVEIKDEQTTITDVECWVKQFVPTQTTASVNKTKWTKSEIVKFAEKNNAIEFTSREEFSEVNNKGTLETIGYAKDVNGNCTARLWQDKKTQKYYYCTHKYTLMTI